MISDLANGVQFEVDTGWKMYCRRVNMGPDSLQPIEIQEKHKQRNILLIMISVWL